MSIAPTAFVGRSVRRSMIDRAVRGRATYVGDIPVPGALEVSLVRSPVAHAELLGVEVEKARNVPGVVAIFTAEDLVGVGAQSPIWDLAGQRRSDVRALAEGRLRYVGEPYAVVVARSAEAARAAARLVTPKLNILPPVLSIDAGLAPDAPRIFPKWPDNIAATSRWQAGNVEAAFAQAAEIVGGSFTSQRVHPFSMEGRGVIARPEADGSLTLWTSTQSIHQVRAALGETLGLAEHRVRVIAPDVGGAFGMKAFAYGEETLLAFIALKLDRPVRWIESRKEAFVGSYHGRDERLDIEVAFESDGHILAVRCRGFLDKGGDVCGSSIGTVWASGAMLTSGYRVPAVDIEVKGVMTNKTPTGAYRGYGQPEATQAIERCMDIAGRRLGLHPAEIRRRNLVRPEEMPFTTATGLTLDSGRYAELMDMVLERIDFDTTRKRHAVMPKGKLRRGIGFACFTELTNFGHSPLNRLLGVSTSSFDIVNVRMEPSGHVRVFASQTPMGQGLEVVLAQICADELTLPIEDVSVLYGDTLNASFTGYASGGGRGTGVGGGAVALACRNLANQIRRWGAHLLEAPLEQVSLVQGGIQVADDPTRRMSMAAVARAAYLGQSYPEGLSGGLEAREVYDPPAVAFSYGTVAAEVSIDVETGKVKVERLVFGHDCGVQINPKMVEGQVCGGAVQAIGATLFEEIVYSDDGVPLMLSMHDYLVPLASDVPTIDMVHLETPSPFSVLGSKGVGESGTIGVPAAIMNAVQDAIGDAALVDTLPLRAERMVELLSRERV